MPVVGLRCHELRVRDRGRDWRLVYRVDSDVVLILEVFEKRTQKTPPAVIHECQRRLREYDQAVKEG
jgi:phage-related protein